MYHLPTRLGVIFVIIGLFSIMPVLADVTVPANQILNPDFATHVGTITTMNESGQEGLFVYDSADNLVLMMLHQDVMEASFQYLGGYLTAYSENGQALFALPDGNFQMQIATPNGGLNFKYGNQQAGLQGADALSMESNVLLKQSDDGLMQLYLLTSGELRVAMQAPTEDVIYTLTFTGIPALNIKQAIHAQ